MYNVDDYKDMIQDAFEKKGLVGKNHDYFSRIRGQIRAVADSKEEYESLRDDILGGYDKYRKKEGKDYVIRGSLKDENGNRVKPIQPSDNVLHNDDGEAVFPMFSVGCVNDFSEKRTCFDEGVKNLKKMDNQQIKYTWTLGKDGLFLIKYKRMDTSFDELPKNEQGHGITNKLIMDAEYNSYSELNSKFRKDNRKELDELMNQYGNNNITYNELTEQENALHYDYVKTHMDDYIGNINKNLIDNNLVNQATGEPLFEFAFAKSGR